MGISKSHSTVSVLIFIFITTGFVLITVGTATNGWVEVDYGSKGSATYGLFEACVEDTCVDLDADTLKYAGTLKAIRAFCIAGAISSGIALVLSIMITITTCQPSSCIANKKRLGTVCAFLCFCAGVLTAIGVVLFHARWYKDVFSSCDGCGKGASFNCCIAGLVVMVVDGIIVLIYARQGTSESTAGQIIFRPQIVSVSVTGNQTQQQQQYLQSQPGQFQGQHPHQGAAPLQQQQWSSGQMNQDSHMQQPSNISIRPPSYRSSELAHQASQPTNPSAPRSSSAISDRPPSYRSSELAYQSSRPLNPTAPRLSLEYSLPPLSELAADDPGNERVNEGPSYSPC